MRAGTRVGLGAISLLEPLTGIGRYTWHLASELQKRLAPPPLLFYGAGWSEEIRSQPLPTLIAGTKKAIARLIPRPYVLSRFIMQRRFSAGARRIDLYHEPNYVAFRYQGPTVVTVHDL